MTWWCAWNRRGSCTLIADRGVQENSDATPDETKPWGPHPLSPCWQSSVPGDGRRAKPGEVMLKEGDVSLCGIFTRTWTHAIVYVTKFLIKTCVVVQHVDSSIHAENVCIFSSSKPNHEVYVWLAELNMERYFDAFLEDGWCESVILCLSKVCLGCVTLTSLCLILLQVRHNVYDPTYEPWRHPRDHSYEKRAWFEDYGGNRRTAIVYNCMSNAMNDTCIWIHMYHKVVDWWCRYTLQETYPCSAIARRFFIGVLTLKTRDQDYCQKLRLLCSQ